MSSQTSSNDQQADQQGPETETSADLNEQSSGASDFAKALAELTQDDEPGDDDSGEDNGKPRESGKNVKLDSLDTLAASLNIEVKDLYAIKVPASGGREAMTIGQIKDRFTSFDSLETDRLALTERQVQQEAEFEQTRVELRELLAVVPKEHLSQEKLQAAAQRVAARNAADGKRLLEAMPEWRDTERRDAEVTDIANAIGKYGIPASYIKTIRNPALLKFMRDAARREKQVQAALATVKKIPRKKAAPQQSRTPPRIQSQHNARSPNASAKPTSERERYSAALKTAT